jgi:hypothetical protein
MSRCGGHGTRKQLKCKDLKSLKILLLQVHAVAESVTCRSYSTSRRTEGNDKAKLMLLDTVQIYVTEFTQDRDWCNCPEQVSNKFRSSLSEHDFQPIFETTLLHASCTS